jgi:hypothetical protein
VRYWDIIQAGQRAEKAAMRSMMDQVRAAHAARLWPEIDRFSPGYDAMMHFKAECDGLTVHVLGEAFAGAFQSRRLWCRENCASPFTVEPILAAHGHDVGRRFRFSDKNDATRFRSRWC